MTGTAAHVTAVVDVDRRPVGNGKTGDDHGPPAEALPRRHLLQERASTRTGARPRSRRHHAVPSASRYRHPLGAARVCLGIRLRGAARPPRRDPAGLAFDRSFCYLIAAVFFGVGLVFAYWTYACCRACATASTATASSIHWGFVRQVIPLDSVKRVAPRRADIARRASAASTGPATTSDAPRSGRSARRCSTRRTDTSRRSSTSSRRR